MLAVLLPVRVAAQLPVDSLLLPAACDSATLQLPEQPVFGTDLSVVGSCETGTVRPLGVPLRDRSEQFRAKQLILPLSLVAVSTFGLWNKRAQDVNRRVRNQFLLWRGERGLHFDDYVQYLPAASYLLLGVAGVKARHNFKERMIVLGTSWLAMGILVNGVKYAVREERPDASARNSYPSGHTATAFMGAELIRREYGTGYGVAAYAVACGIGVMRMYNNRHWLNDVLAGAGFGILSAEIGYWMLPLTRRLFGMRSERGDLVLAAAPFYDLQTHAVGGGVSLRFH